jgi:2-polyprenyl-3-methyl-5-hydroxy-6-metoxy-1,4-benzoquinol methylase
MTNGTKKEDLDKAFFYHDPRYEGAFIRALINKYKMSCGSTIIDIGCGNGLYCDIFNKYGMRVTGFNAHRN